MSFFSHQDFEKHNRHTLLPELEQKKGEITKELDSIRSEKEKLARWLLGADLTAQAVRFLNSHVDTLSARETEAQERLWQMEDEINSIQVKTYNTSEICERFKEFIRTFPELLVGEWKLLIDSLIEKVEIRKKAVTLSLKPPLSSFGYLSPSLAPSGIEPLFDG